MSFRETRNLTEMLRSLGFPRQVSLENFRVPNFDLVAELLRWLAARFDPTFEIPFDTDSESERVLFIKAVVEFLATKAHVKLNAKKLYSADLACVRELLKATSLLYSAIRPSAQQEGDDGVSVTRTDFDLSDRLHDLKQTRQLASEITQRGATLFDLLGREVDLRAERSAAVARPLEIGTIEQTVRQSIAATNDQISQTLSMLDNLASDEANLEAKIEKKKANLERTQKRLRSLQAVRPAFMDEYEKLEAELTVHYESYINKHRTLCYLESQLEEHNHAEQEQLADTESQLKRMQTRLKEEELRMLRDDGVMPDPAENFDEFGGEFSDDDLGDDGEAGGGVREGQRVFGTMDGPDDDSQELSDDDSDSDSEDSDDLLDDDDGDDLGSENSFSDNDF